MGSTYSAHGKHLSFTAQCLPTGRCTCECHSPLYGVAVCHFAPCCDRSGMMDPEED